MIRGYTGAIGSGKSAQMVYEIVLGEFKDRPVYTHGIKWEIKLPHVRTMYCRGPDCLVCGEDPERHRGPFVEEWFEWMEKTYVLCVDEAHHPWPKRTKDKEPASVTRLRESRKFGLDFMIATQAPLFLDVDVRRLFNMHYHVVQGPKSRTLKIFNEYVDDTQNGRPADVRPFLLPKEIFDYYESAKVHTVMKRKVPFKLQVAVVVIGVLCVAGAFAFSFVYEDGKIRIGDSAPVAAVATPAVPVADPVPQAPARSFMSTAPVEVDESTALFDFTPAIRGIPESAPAFAGLVRNVSAPRLAGCIVSVDKGWRSCQCYSEQGTRYITSPARCRAVVEGAEYQPRLQTIYPASNGFSPVRDLE